jgi:Mrp family chromosome partitioning ATPase
MDRRDVAAEVRRLGRMLRDQAWIVVICVAVAVGAAALYESTKETTYVAQAKVLLLQDDPNATLSGTGVFLDPVRQRATALELITGPNVAARAARQLRTKRPLPAVHASASGDSNVVTIFAGHKDPRFAARTADAYAKQYVEFRRDVVRARYDQALADVRNRIRRLQQNKPFGYADQLKQLATQSQQLSLLASTRLPDATLIQRANGNATPVRPRWTRNLLLAAIAGLLVGLALAFVRDRLDDRIKSEEDVAEALPGIPVLATVPRWRPGQRWRREAAESYNNLGVSVRSVNGSTASSYLVTSAIGEDGKSTTALNLALALGREGRNAMLVDGDLRRPRVTEMINAPRGDGFVKVLAGESRLEEVATRHQFRAEQKNGLRRGRKPLVTVQGDVSVLPAGRTNTAPQRLITEQSAQALLDQARDEDRYTVIDGPPLGLFGDMLPLARNVDGVVVVLRLYHTRKRALRNLVRQLETAGVRPIGLVLVGTPPDSDSFYGY